MGETELKLLLIGVFDGFEFFIVVIAAIAVVTDVWSVIAEL